MSTGAKSPVTTAESISEEQVARFQRDGFTAVRNLLDADEVARFAEATLAISDAEKTRGDQEVFDQHVNVWVRHETIRPLTLHPRIARVAEKLSGASLRLWHDHILIKRPRNATATEFHQDQPYWPISNDLPALSCWVALCDVPVERGCMTFLPGSHRRRDLQAQNLRDSESLFTICPEMRYHPRVTLPLRAGDCTFHYGCCAHMANANNTDEPRLAHAIIYMDRTATFNGHGHVITQPLGLEVGAALDGPLFPAVDRIEAGDVGVPAEYARSGMRESAGMG